MSYMNKLDSLTFEQIRDILDELKSQIFHLERSQQELLDALDTFPGDEDFAEAYKENIDVIDSKKYNFQKILDHLEGLDPSFRRDQYELNGKSSTTTQSTTSGPALLESDDEEDEPLEANPPNINTNNDLSEVLEVDNNSNNASSETPATIDEDGGVFI